MNNTIECKHEWELIEKLHVNFAEDGQLKDSILLEVCHKCNSVSQNTYGGLKG